MLWRNCGGVKMTAKHRWLITWSGPPLIMLLCILCRRPCPNRWKNLIHCKMSLWQGWKIIQLFCNPTHFTCQNSMFKTILHYYENVNFQMVLKWFETRLLTKIVYSRYVFLLFLYISNHPSFLTKCAKQVISSARQKRYSTTLKIFISFSHNYFLCPSFLCSRFFFPWWIF